MVSYGERPPAWLEEAGECRKRLGHFQDDMNGMRVWGTSMEGRIGSCRSELDDYSQAARNMFNDFNAFKVATEKRLAAIEERLAKLEGGGNVVD